MNDNVVSFAFGLMKALIASEAPKPVKRRKTRLRASKAKEGTSRQQIPLMPEYAVETEETPAQAMRDRRSLDEMWRVPDLDAENDELESLSMTGDGTGPRM